MVAVSVAPEPTAVLTPEEVAAWLKVRPRQLERLKVPCVKLGHRTRRYLAREVLSWLESRSAGVAPSAALS